MRRPFRMPLSVLTLAFVCAATAAERPSMAQSQPKRSPASAATQAKQEGLRAAVAAYERGDYATAQREVQPLLQAHPADFQLNELAGLLEAARGRDQQANPYLAKSVRLAPNNAAARSALAMNLMRLHRPADAEIHFRKAVELEPDNPDANHNLGEFYIQVGKVASAIPYLKRAQDLQPTNYNNGYDLALAYEQTGALADARQQLEALVKIRDTAELHSVLGEVEEKSKNYVAAARQYEQAARMDPSESNIFDFGAELLLHQTFEPAVAVFQAGAARYPASARLALGLGIALYGNSHYDDGAAQFFRVADANPSDPLPMLFVGRSYDNFSPPVAEQARARLQCAVEAFPANAPLRYYYAAALWKLHQENPDAAPLGGIESLLKNAIALDPKFGDAYLQLGIVYASQQKFADAIAAYRQALKFSRATAPIHYRLGQALSRTGDTAEAQKEFAIFETERAKETSASEKQNAEIEQFVYTMKKPGE